MINFSINAAALGPVLLVLALSLALGVVATLLGKAAGFIGELFLGIAVIVAGGRSSELSHRARPKGGVAVRSIIYVALCVVAFVLSSNGHQGWAYLSAVVGGVCLPIAIGKLID